MNDTGFDALTRRLTALLTRRTTLATALGAWLGRTAFTAAPVSAGMVEFPCLEKGAGERCKRSGQCCSGRCRKRRSKRKGRCQCSRLTKPCGHDTDCCGHVAGDNDTPICSAELATAVCCIALGGDCLDTSHCCGDLRCNPANFCDIPT
jgi:hypothetical protein